MSKYSIIQYEHRSQPLLPWPQFVKRFLTHFGLGMLFIIFSLFMGMAGYHFFDGFDWLESFLNASMILAGMGPVDKLSTVGGKLFGGCYAIYSGIAFLSIVAVIFTPIIHRLAHKLHLQGSNTNEKPD